MRGGRRSRKRPHSAPGTSCFRARAHRSRAGTARSRDCIDWLPRLAEMGFDVLYLAADSSDRHDVSQGKEQRDQRRAGRCRLSVGHWLERRGSQGDLIRSWAPWPTCSNWSPRPREHGIDVALDIAFQCSPDHPYVKEHPAVVSPAAGRHDPVRRKPAQEVSGHLSVRFREPRLAGAVAGIDRRGAVLVRPGHPHFSRRQSAHQAVCVLGVSDRARSRRNIPRRSFSPRRSPGPR